MHANLRLPQAILVLVLALMILGVLSACDSTEPEANPAACTDRSGGALVTFQIVEETYSGWFTDETFIATAEQHLADGTTQVPNFGQVIAGTGCDDQWSFHVAADNVEFADFTIELCSAVPSHIEANLADWIDQVGGWCPWSAEVISVTRMP